jgi:hypothetical protein
MNGCGQLRLLWNPSCPKVNGSVFIDNQSRWGTRDAVSLNQVQVLNDVELDMANGWKAIRYIIENFAGNSARLAKLGRKLQERHLRRMIMIQVKVFGQPLLWGHNFTTKFAIA